LKEYLAADEQDNIIILGPGEGRARGTNAVCFTRSDIEKQLQDLTTITLPCLGPNGAFPVDANAQFVKIQLREFPVYVPKSDVLAMISSSARVFEPKLSNLTLQTTASADAVENSDFVSADHCQAGTTKKIYRIHGIRITKRSRN
jgi:hypothetical protein